MDAPLLWASFWVGLSCALREVPFVDAPLLRASLCLSLSRPLGRVPFKTAGLLRASLWVSLLRTLRKVPFLNVSLLLASLCLSLSRTLGRVPFKTAGRLWASLWVSLLRTSRKVPFLDASLLLASRWVSLLRTLRKVPFMDVPLWASITLGKQISGCWGQALANLQSLCSGSLCTGSHYRWWSFPKAGTHENSVEKHDALGSLKRTKSRGPISEFSTSTSTAALLYHSVFKMFALIFWLRYLSSIAEI